MSTLSDFALLDIDGNEKKLADFEGKAVLVVNVASKCGLTPQYDGLERLYQEYRHQGLEILGVPCNQFMGQEPGREAEIKKFCQVQYGVSFPLFSKVEVNGEGRDPLYAWLCAEDSGPEESGDVRWNFSKFLIDRQGQIAARFSPQVEPCSDEIKAALRKLL